MPGLTGLAVLVLRDTAVVLIPALVTAYAVVMGGVVLAAGWQLFGSERPPRRFRRGAVIGGRGSRPHRMGRRAR